MESMSFQEGLTGTECVWELSGQGGLSHDAFDFLTRYQWQNCYYVRVHTFFFFLTFKRVKRVENHHYNPSPWITPAAFNGFTQNGEPNGHLCEATSFNEAWKNDQKANSQEKKEGTKGLDIPKGLIIP